jgi:hypothetical protein
LKSRSGEFLAGASLGLASILGVTACGASVSAESRAPVHSKYTGEIDALAKKVIALAKTAPYKPNFTVPPYKGEPKDLSFGFRTSSGQQDVYGGVQTSTNTKDASKTINLNVAQWLNPKDDSEGYVPFNLDFRHEPNGTWTASCTDTRSLTELDQKKVILNKDTVLAESNTPDADAILSDYIHEAEQYVNNFEKASPDAPVTPFHDICRVNIG